MKLPAGLWPLGLSMLGACAAMSTTGCSTPSPPVPQARVTGSVTYLPRVALPPGAVIKVQLIDVSRADAPAAVLGEQLIQAEGRLPPFAFAITYDPSRIQPNMSYAVGARIEDGARLLFINDQRHAVLTRGAPTHVDMVLRAVAAARP